jgi:hypothetical protein
MYFSGSGVSEDKQKGAELLGQAAAQGHAHAQPVLERLRTHETKVFEDARVQKQHVRDLLTEHRSLIPRGSEETAMQALQRNGEMRSEQLREARQVLSAVLRGMPEDAEALALEADVRKELGVHIASMRAQEELSSLTTSLVADGGGKGKNTKKKRKKKKRKSKAATAVEEQKEQQQQQQEEKQEEEEQEEEQQQEEEEEEEEEEQEAGNAKTEVDQEVNQARSMAMAGKKKSVHVCGRTGCGQSPSTMMKCGKCKLTYYCNRQCQRADWQAHKERCKGEALAHRAREARAAELMSDDHEGRGGESEEAKEEKVSGGAQQDEQEVRHVEEEEEDAKTEEDELVTLEWCDLTVGENKIDASTVGKEGELLTSHGSSGDGWVQGRFQLVANIVRIGNVSKLPHHADQAKPQFEVTLEADCTVEDVGEDGGLQWAVRWPRWRLELRLSARTVEEKGEWVEALRKRRRRPHQEHLTYRTSSSSARSPSS